MHPHEIGRLGEKVAASWLKGQRCKILRRNFKPAGGGELDLIFRDGLELVFGEVKSRTRTDYGAPSRAVDDEKKRLIKRGARQWMKWIKVDFTHRYDILEVVFLPDQIPQINWIKNAFE